MTMKKAAVKKAAAKPLTKSVKKNPKPKSVQRRPAPGVPHETRKKSDPAEPVGQMGLDLPGDNPLAGVLDARLLVPLAVAAMAFGISETALKKWRVKHRDTRGRQTLYYLPDLIDHRIKRADSGENDLSKQRARLAMAQSEKTELEVAQLRGDLIPASVILSHWPPLVGSVRQKVMAIKTKVKTQIPTLTDDELQKIDAVCRATLEDLADSGIPKPTK